MKQIVYIDQADLTETEFFERELSFNLQLVNPSLLLEGKAHQDEEFFWIATTRPEVWHSFLNNSSRQSVVFFYLGNELYNLRELEFLTSHTSILALFNYGLKKSPSFLNLLSPLIASVIDSGKNTVRDILPFFRNMRTGLQVLNRLDSFDSKDCVIFDLPQGYSSSFARQLVRFLPQLEDGGSILDRISLIDDYTASIPTRFEASFVGQDGNLRRRRILSLANNSFGETAWIVIKSRFGGNDSNPDSLYLDSLLLSKHCLIPSGVFNNYNHRYSEALIMGKLPIVACNNLTDPNENYYWTRIYPIVFRDSFRFLIWRLRRFGEREIAEILLNARQADLQKLDAFRIIVQQYIDLCRKK
jgi:hypothetical protein